MELKIRTLDWKAGFPEAMMNQTTASKLGIHAMDRISIRTQGKRVREIFTNVETIVGILRKGELGISKELKDTLNLKQGQKVDINLINPPESLDFIKKKLNGKRLSGEEINEIIKDVVNNSLSEPEIALFVSGMYKNGMNNKETIELIKAIGYSGNQLKINRKYVGDKHSIGGVPGNRTTPLVISICAAAGLTMPKTSSRAITSAAGTADVIEAIAKVEFSIPEIKKIIKKADACMVWGGALGVVPADSKIIKVEKILKIDPEAQLLASIMSKKIAMGAKYIIIDIPYGKGSKFESKKKALQLKKKFESLGKYFGKKLKCVLTDGTQPIGKGIGPVMELYDVISILDPKKEGPKDLEEKSLLLSAKLLELSGKAKKNKGLEMAKEILHSGKAFKKFKEIIKAQGGNTNRLKLAKLKKNILAKKSGKIKNIVNEKISSMAMVTGCPLDKSCGLYLHVEKGQKVKKGEKLITVYANTKNRLNDAVKFFKKEKPILFR
ncbi:MAG: thymidine phosphorylase [Candidatus Pacearchaeota archaeon]